MSHGNRESGKPPRRQPDEHLPNLDVGALPTSDRAEAFLQELRAGAAPLERIIPLAGEIPRPNMSGRRTVATVPFLTVPTVQWSKVTIGDSIGALIKILQERGGLWLAKHVSALVEWTVGPTVHDPNTANSEQADSVPNTWVRVDLQFAGAWNSRFALASPVLRVAESLWPISISPIIAVLPDEIATKALPSVNGDEPIGWDAFGKALDNVPHVYVRPSEAIRELVRSHNLPGAYRCS